MKIFGINLSNTKKENLLKEITKFDKQNIVFTPNPEILLISKTDKEFKEILEKANFLTID
jgi:UDP-N-acetyl-D-mannosaminuronic acid transferase (WecB/TagA/CpsF family)